MTLESTKKYSKHKVTLDILKLSMTLKNLWPITQKHLESTMVVVPWCWPWLVECSPPAGLPATELAPPIPKVPKSQQAPPIPNKVPTGASSYVDPSPMSCCPVLIFWLIQNLGARRIRNILDWDFLDALASLDFKLSVSGSGMFLQVAHLRVFQIYF